MDHNGAERPIAPTALGWYRPKRCWCPQRDVARWLRTALDYVRLSCVANLFSVQFSSSLPTTRRHRSSSNQQIQMRDGRKLRNPHACSTAPTDATVCRRSRRSPSRRLFFLDALEASSFN